MSDNFGEEVVDETRGQDGDGGGIGDNFVPSGASTGMDVAPPAQEEEKTDDNKKSSTSGVKEKIITKGLFSLLLPQPLL